MEILLKAHSGVRWLVLVALLVTLIVSLIAWLRGQGSPRKFMSISTGVMDLQALMGIILLLWAGFTGGGFPAKRLEHAVTMLIAVVVGHLAAKWKSAPPAVQGRNYTITIIVILLLVIAGISRLPQGWGPGSM